MKPQAGKAASQNNPGQVLSDQRLITPFIFAKLDGCIEQENINNHSTGEDNLINETWPLDKSIYAFSADVETETINGYGIRLVFERQNRHEDIGHRPSNA